MERKPFNKPLPCAPLAEEVWIRQADRAEVGREAFFFGRDAEYEAFQNVANNLLAGRVGGDTIIFQGAPGAGKTALMQECMEAVRRHSTPQHPWVALSVSPGDLRLPAYVMSALIRATDEESRRLSKLALGASAKIERLLGLGKRALEELSRRGFAVAGISVSGKSDTGERSDLDMSAAELFSNAAELLEGINFVVFVDEAQNTPIEPTTKQVLDCLHRDTQKISLVTVCFGLSNTQDVLKKCGISRLALERIVNLEPLSLEDAKGSFRRMIETYYKGSDEQKVEWSASLAELSQGWPQHITRIGVAAGRVLHDNDGKLEKRLLEQAIEQGIKQKNDYYDYRIAAGYRNAKLYVELAVAADLNSNGFLELDELEDISEKELHRSGTSFDDFLLESLHAGLLAPVKGPLTRYKFPIPSLGDYLRSQARCADRR